MHRIGFGTDIHRLVTGRPLVLGGVEIESELGAEGHSDADVLIHAVTDAILGALALGDIGAHFPNEEERWRNAESSQFICATPSVLLVKRGTLWRILIPSSTSKHQSFGSISKQCELISRPR